MTDPRDGAGSHAEVERILRTAAMLDPEGVRRVAAGERGDATALRVAREEASAASAAAGWDDELRWIEERTASWARGSATTFPAGIYGMLGSDHAEVPIRARAARVVADAALAALTRGRIGMAQTEELERAWRTAAIEPAMPDAVNGDARRSRWLTVVISLALLSVVIVALVLGLPLPLRP